MRSSKILSRLDPWRHGCGQDMVRSERIDDPQKYGPLVCLVRSPQPGWFTGQYRQADGPWSEPVRRRSVAAAQRAAALGYLRAQRGHLPGLLPE
jgi:hypothetical protein